MTEKINIISQEHTHTSDLKLKYLGYGEWVEELDDIIFEYKGFNCNISRMFLKEPCVDAFFGGHLCGYVDLPEDHKFFEKKYDDIDVDCHGGLTFSEEKEGKWRIGFDCAHSFDYCPSLEFFKKTNKRMLEFKKKFPLPKGYEDFSLFYPAYRNVEFCINECCSIVDQLLEE